VGRRSRAYAPADGIEDFGTWKAKTAQTVRNTTSDSPAHIARCAEAAAVIEATRDVGDIVDAGVWLPFWLCAELGVAYRHWR
jgi:hypothetical protein